MIVAFIHHFCRGSSSLKKAATMPSLRRDTVMDAAESNSLCTAVFCPQHCQLPLCCNLPTTLALWLMPVDCWLLAMYGCCHNLPQKWLLQCRDCAMMLLRSWCL